MQNANKKTGGASTIYALPVDVTRGNRIPVIFVLNPCFSYVPACIIALGTASCKARKIGIWLCPTKEMQNKMQNGFLGFQSLPCLLSTYSIHLQFRVFLLVVEKGSDRKVPGVTVRIKYIPFLV